MKKIFRFMMAAVAAAVAMTSCQQENIEPDVQEQETVQVKVTIGAQTKGFTDLEGITWEVGDQIKYAGGVELTSEPLTAEQISADGYTASFTFASSLNEVDRSGWFVSTKCCPRNYDEVDFTKTAAADNVYTFTQDQAGEMNKDYLFLHSGTGVMNITKGQAPEITMDIVGSVFRVIPYTTKYNTESIVSVKMVSNTKFVGTVVYDRGGSKYIGAHEKNYFAASTLYAMLGSSFSLEGVTSAEASQGIYMAVAATPADAPLDGYKYIIQTDMAMYTFDAMDKSLEVGENVVKNVLLNLDKAERKEKPSGELRYTGSLNDFECPEAGITDKDLGYWFAQIKAEGSDEWFTRENGLINNNAAQAEKGDVESYDGRGFYSNVTFAVIDNATGEPADWVSAKYNTNSTHWVVTVLPNDGEARSATITATFDDVDRYMILEASKTKTVVISQVEAGYVPDEHYTYKFGDITHTNVPAVITTGPVYINVIADENVRWKPTIAMYQNNSDTGVNFTNMTIVSHVREDGGWYYGNGYVAVHIGENLTYSDVRYEVTFTTDSENVASQTLTTTITQSAKQVPAEGFTFKWTDCPTEIPVAGGPTYFNIANDPLVEWEAVVTIDGTVHENNTIIRHQNGGGYVCVHVPENTTATTKEVKVVVTTTSEYVYTDKTITAVATQLSANTGEGDDDVLTEGYTYDIAGRAGADGMIIGWNSNTTAVGNYIELSNIKLNGNPVTVTEAIAEELIAKAFKLVDERPAAGFDTYGFATDQQISVAPTFMGDSVLQVSFNTGAEKGVITRLTWYGYDGTEAGYYYIHVPF